MAKIPLSILLIKEGVTTEAGYLKEIPTPSCPIEGVGTLYFKNSAKKDARRIQDFFGAKLPLEGAGVDRPVLFTAIVQAVLIVPVDCDGATRLFAVCFGMGRNLLNADVIQDKFGMYTVLNSIDPKTIRSVDLNRLESIPKHDRRQTSKLSKLNTFELNVERDLLRAVTGRAKDVYQAQLGETITGADALRITIDLAIDNLPNRLGEIYEVYKKQDYKTDFGWIDKISPLKDPARIAQLETELIEKINRNEIDTIWMSIPELVDWNQLNSIRYSKKGADYYDLEIKSVLSDVFLDEPVTKASLQSRVAYACDNTGNSFIHWSLYKCLYAEIDLNPGIFILNNGQWYQIDSNYETEVKSFYNSATISAQTFSKAHLNEIEGNYNIRIAQEDPAKRLLMDKRLVKPAPGEDEIEFCDIYTTDKELYHVKRYSGSATLSHLFNQGLVSGELLMQKAFRKNLNQKIDKIDQDFEHRDLSGWHVAELESDFHRGDYKIIYAIITDSNATPPAIPFFSKVTFRHACSRLADYGYQVSIMRIEIDNAIDDNEELTQKKIDRKAKARAKKAADVVASEEAIAEAPVQEVETE